MEASQAKAKLINVLAIEEPPPEISDEDIQLSETVEGGPKTSKVPDYSPIPKEQLLSEVHFRENLSLEQKKKMEEIVLKHQKAFGLDGRLGNYPADVEIPLRPGVKEVSLAPYPASPAKREVIDKQVDDWL